MNIQSKLPHIGTTIFTEMSALAKKHNAINLAQGFPDFKVDHRLTNYLQEALAKDFNQYAPMAGLPLLLDALGEKIKSKNNKIVIPEKEITITPGATYGIYTAIATIIHPGDEVIILEPAYDSYSPNVLSQGGIAVPVPLNPKNFRPQWDKINAAVTNKTKAIIINSPHNPTGSNWEQADYIALKNVVKNTEIKIISDEVYEYLSFDQQKHFSVLEDEELYARSFVVFSFGKVLQATGWKIGYVVAPEPLMNEFRKMHQYIAFSINAPAQYAIGKYLQGENNLETLQSTFEEKRDYFLSLIKDLPFTMPFKSQGSYFQVLSYAGLSEKNDKAFAIKLTKEAGVATIPVSPFYEKGTDNKLLRFCFAKNDDTLLEGCNRLKNYFS